MRSHFDFHQALLFVGIVIVDSLLITSAFAIEGNQTNLGMHKNVSIFRLSSVKDVVKAQITSFSFAMNQTKRSYTEVIQQHV